VSKHSANTTRTANDTFARAFDFRADPLERFLATQPGHNVPTHRVFIARVTGPATITHRPGYR
jgi:hypothetical protein